MELFMSKFLLGYQRNYYTNPSILELLTTDENQEYSVMVYSNSSGAFQGRIDWRRW
jgi:hypothetical protein